jgi:hypothetical protein
LIVEENATAAIDLEIYEAGGQEGTGGEACLRPIGGNLAPAPKSNDAPVPDQNRGFVMPVVTVKNTVRQDGMPVGDGRIISTRAHLRQLRAGLVVQQTQSK